MTIVRVTSGGIPVTESPSGIPYYEADNGFGIPVTFVEQGGAPLGRAGLTYWINLSPSTTAKVKSGFAAMQAGTRNMVIKYSAELRTDCQPVPEDRFECVFGHCFSSCSDARS